MARKERTMVTIVDDLTGEEQQEGTGQTVPFVWQGRAYEIDLSDYNAAKFLGAMAPYVEKARRVRNSPAVTPSAPRVGGDGRRRGGGRGMGRSKEELDTIRAWARANGHTVADSGIVPKRVLEAYEARETVPTTPPDRPRPSPAPRHEAEVKAPEKATDEKPEPVGSGEAAPSGDQGSPGPVPATPSAIRPAFQPPKQEEPQHTSAARRLLGGRGSENR